MQIPFCAEEQDWGFNEALVMHWLYATCLGVNFLHILKILLPKFVVQVFSRPYSKYAVTAGAQWLLE